MHMALGRTYRRQGVFLLSPRPVKRDARRVELPDWQERPPCCVLVMLIERRQLGFCTPSSPTCARRTAHQPCALLHVSVSCLRDKTPVVLRRSTYPTCFLAGGISRAASHAPACSALFLIHVGRLGSEFSLTLRKVRSASVSSCKVCTHRARFCRRVCLSIVHRLCCTADCPRRFLSCSELCGREPPPKSNEHHIILTLLHPAPPYPCLSAWCFSFIFSLMSSSVSRAVARNLPFSNSSLYLLSLGCSRSCAQHPPPPPPPTHTHHHHHHHHHMKGTGTNARTHVHLLSVVVTICTC